MKFNKKGNLQLALTGIMTIVLAAFLLVMGLIMLDNLLLDQSDTTVTVVNETLTTVTELGEVVALAGACGFRGMSVTIITNESSGDTIQSANYTYTTREGRVTSVASGNIFNGTDWNITYDYTFGNSTACQQTNTTIGGLGDFGDYVDLLVLAVVIAVILSLILTIFSMRRSVR